MHTTIRFELDVPVQNMNHLLSERDRDDIMNILRSYKVEDVYHPEKETVISCRNVLDRDSDVHAGHKLWKQQHPSGLKTPNGLPRLEERAAAGDRLIQLSIEYVDKLTPGFFSKYGFIGYYLSVIVDMDKKIILDARGEIATE